MLLHFHLLLHPQLIPHFLHLYQHLAITLYFIIHQKLNILKNENKEEFLTASTFCTFDLIEKRILRKWLSQDPLSKVHLNKHGLYFKFIHLLLGDLNLNPGTTSPTRNDIFWEVLPFHNCSFSTERLDFLPILYLRLAKTHETYFKKEACTPFIQM